MTLSATFISAKAMVFIIMPKSINQDTPASSRNSLVRLFKRLGPGLITGAADDDPSGIATYSQVGAQFGMGLLWTMLFSFPLMMAMQEICGRLGRITGVGIAKNLRQYYPRPLLYGVVLLLCAANIFNLGADITAMGAAAQLVFGGSLTVYAVAFGTLSLLLQIYIPYAKYVNYLKWLTAVLFAYVATAFVVHVPWLTALRSTVLPSFQWQRDYWMALVAILGTTISPYLFFWQASEEAEDVCLEQSESPLKEKPGHAIAQFRRIAVDTRFGMAFSNLIAFFIILTTGVTLHLAAGNSTIQTSADAAKALQPLAGNIAFVLFALGIVGTGLLAVPVLAGSGAYAVAETFGWRASLECKPRQAPQFYAVLTGATVIGVALNFFKLDPIRALYWSAVINGLVAVPLMGILMIMSANSRVVGKFLLPNYLRILGWIATVVMLLASLAFTLSALFGHS
jgi:NRAMP (natural resistance-associated macrophage protein)-like metal ion transporter